jgi:hypothetical protein
MSNPFGGKITWPTGDNRYSANVQDGLVPFISNIISLITLVAGLWAFFNLIVAGLNYIANGDKPDELKKTHERIYMSIIGLAVIASSYVLAGVIGMILFGDPLALINIRIAGPGNSNL